MKGLLTRLLISYDVPSPRKSSIAKIGPGYHMSNAASYSEGTDRLRSEKPISEERALEPGISSTVENKIGNDGERIRASVALFTTKSIKELEGLTFELNGLQEFLKSETERVQREIDSALSGLRIIIDTISPWINVRPESSDQEKTLKTEPRSQRLNLANGQR